MTREGLSLDGEWQFLFDATCDLSPGNLPLDANGWRTAQVPMPWQAQFDDLRLSTGAGWYRRQFSLPASWRDSGAVILHFDAVFYHASVWLNGHFLGEYAGGYFPFSFDIRDIVQAENTLIVCAITPSDDPDKYPDYPFSEILHGKQNWYGHWGGIWQSVRVEHRPTTYMDHLHLTPDVTTKRVTCRIDCNHAEPNVDFHAELIAPEWVTVATTSGTLSEQSQTITLTLTDSPLLWSPDTPNLYRVRVTLSNGDVTEKPCGFRTISARDGQIFLNGEPFYMRGALDQDYYPDTLTTPPGIDFLEDQMRKAKAMGLNTLRYHIKIPDPRYLEAADRVGLLIWVDLPTWTQLTAGVEARIRQAFTAMLKRDHHHPSIAIWTIVNEDWGTDLVHNADHRAWLLETFDWLKAQDPTRLIVDNSPCEPNYHLKSDIDDYHFYRAIPDHADEWDDFVNRLADRDNFTYSPHGDAQRTRKEPLIVSEFGNWGLPNIDALTETGEPWWFETGHDWGEGIVYPHGIEQRFKQWHFDRVFGSLDDLTTAAQWQQFTALKYEIEAIRLRPEIQGYVITELTDLHWECNGLLDIRRNPRVFHHALAHINADALVIARTEATSTTGGASIEIKLFLSTLTDTPVKSVRWQVRGTDQSGEIIVSDAESGLHHLPPVTVTAPDVTEPQYLTLDLIALDAANCELSHNQHQVMIVPPIHAVQSPLFVDDVTLVEQLSALGYTVNNSGDFRVTRKLTPELQTHVWNGGRALLLVDADSGLPEYQSGVVIQQQFPYVSVSPRQGTIWLGDWVSSFSWLRRSGTFANLPGDPLLDAPFAPISPELVMLGCTPDDYDERVLAGLFLGWIHRPAATLLKRRYGQGEIIVTTLNLLNPAVSGASPLARYLLNELIG